MKTIDQVYPFWSELSDMEKNFIITAAYTEKYNKGMLMHRSEDSCKGLITVLSGQLRTYILSEEGREVTLSLRAEAIVVGEEEKVCEGIVEDVYVMGKEVLAYVTIGTAKVRAYIEAEKHFEKGQKVNIGLKNRGVFVFDKETGERLAWKNQDLA